MESKPPGSLLPAFGAAGPLASGVHCAGASQQTMTFGDRGIRSGCRRGKAYGMSDVGLLKTDAFSILIENQIGVLPNTIGMQYDGRQLSGIVISAVDSMKSREAIWKSIREQPNVRLYIDARMGLETLIVHAVRPQIKAERVEYTRSIVPDDQALQEPCTARTICYTPLMAGSIVCSLVKRYVCDETIPARIVLDLATMTLLAGQ